MEPRRLPLLGAAAGALVGILVVGGLVATDVLDPDHVVTGHEAESALVDSWQRSREASYTLEGRFERQKPGIGTLESAVFEAQRPPDRLRRQFGGVEGVLDGQSVACATDDDGNFRCAPNGEAADYAADVEDEVARLASYVSTDPPMYEVASDGGECFLLQQRVAVPEPPYGRRARMCFDDDTGALRFLQVETAEGTDTFTATSIRGVSDGDFRLESDPSYQSRTVRETTTTTGPATTDPADPDDELRSLTDDELFERCQADGGRRELHAEMYRRGTSINDERWVGALGPDGPCLLRGVFYYLEQLG